MPTDSASRTPRARRAPHRGRWLASLLVALAGLAHASPARADDAAFFRDCEVQRRAALVAADGAAIARLMADGARYGHSNGDVDDEASLIRRLASGEIRYRTIVADEEHYDCHADACEVVGTQTLGVSANGRELTVRNQFRATWLRVDGACSLAAYQSSPLVTPAR